MADAEKFPNQNPPANGNHGAQNDAAEHDISACTGCEDDASLCADNEAAAASLNDDQNIQPNQNAQPTDMPKMVNIPEDEYRRLQSELNEYKDKYLRSLAEAENARKRLQKEKQELVQFARENFVNDFLTPIDQFENALKFAVNMSEEVKNWAVGFNMILNHFKEALLNNGVTPFDSLGKNFDPYRHEAVEMVVSDSPPGIVIEECLRGYCMGERIIRPARVKVSQAPSTSDE